MPSCQLLSAEVGNVVANRKIFANVADKTVKRSWMKVEVLKFQEQ